MEWIKCSDKMPSIDRAGHEFLTYDPLWGRSVRTFEMRGTYEGFDWNGGCAANTNVTHYAELPPEPPTV